LEAGQKLESMLRMPMLLLSLSMSLGLDNGFTLPQLGWNSWNHFACSVTEQDVKDTADAFVKHGLKDAGYEYINVDDCWMAMNRTKDGKLVADPVRFPGGMKNLAQYVHSKGLKFGLYSARCSLTCQGRPGSEDHEWIDAFTFAEWNVDYLKYDNCRGCKYGYGSTAFIMQVTRMGDAIKATGRPMFYSTEMGGQTFNADVCNSAREGSDISPSWERILYELDIAAKYAHMAGPGYHNDLDMLEVGNGNLTPDEERSHFGLWCLMSSPLLAGKPFHTPTPTPTAPSCTPLSPPLHTHSTA
jgi:alpha-galactosidase